MKAGRPGARTVTIPPDPSGSHLNGVTRTSSASSKNRSSGGKAATMSWSTTKGSTSPLRKAFATCAGTSAMSDRLFAVIPSTACSRASRKSPVSPSRT